MTAVGHVWASFQVETMKSKAFRPPKDGSNLGQISRIILSVVSLLPNAG
jgi:hypothetical protein